MGGISDLKERERGDSSAPDSDDGGCSGGGCGCGITGAADLEVGSVAADDEGDRRVADALLANSTMPLGGGGAPDSVDAEGGEGGGGTSLRMSAGSAHTEVADAPPPPPPLMDLRAMD